MDPRLARLGCERAGNRIDDSLRYVRGCPDVGRTEFPGRKISALRVFVG